MTCVQRSPEWHAMRKNHIGSSDSYVVYQGSELDKMKLWEKKKGLRDEDPPNHYMQRGMQLEDDARNWLSSKYDMLFLPDVKISNKNPFMMSSIDGICGNVATEIKCPTSRTRLNSAMKGDILRQDQIQMQHHMECWDLEKIIYLIYYSEQDVHEFEFTRDDVFLDLIIARNALFYDCMVSNTPPIAEIKDEGFALLEDDYLVGKKMMQRGKELMDQALDEMKLFTDGTSCRGSQLSMTKYQRKGNVDYSRIPELKGVDLERYRGESSVCWRVSEKEIEKNFKREVRQEIMTSVYPERFK